MSYEIQAIEGNQMIDEIQVTSKKNNVEYTVTVSAYMLEGKHADYATIFDDDVYMAEFGAPDGVFTDLGQVAEIAQGIVDGWEQE